MKKIPVIILLILLILGTAQATSKVYTSGKFQYTLNSNNTITITKYTGNSKKVTIPDNIDKRSVTAIGNWAFQSCDTITEIVIPDSVTHIGKGAFHECSSLKKINIPNNVTLIEASAFEDCSSLSQITLPDRITVINDHTFSGCSALTEITIPYNISSINAYAFANCKNLKQVNIINSNTTYLTTTFRNCPRLIIYQPTPKPTATPTPAPTPKPAPFFSIGSNTIASVVSEYAYLYAHPDYDSDIVSVAYYGSQLTSFSENGIWVYVHDANNNVGYIQKSKVTLLAPTPTPTPIPTPIPTSTPSPVPTHMPFKSVNEKTVAYIAGNANLYAAADTSSNVIAISDQNDILTAVCSNNAWVQVYDNTGDFYFVKKEDVTLSAPTPKPTPTPTPMPKPFSSAGSNVYAVITADSASLYSFPDLQAPVVSTAEMNDFFAAISLNDTWINIFNSDSVLCYIRLDDVNLMERQPKPAFESEFIDKLKTAYDFEAVEDARMFHESFAFQSDVEKMLYHHYISTWRSIHLEMYKEAQMSLDNLAAIPEASEFYTVLEQYGLIGVDSLNTYIQAMLLQENFKAIRQLALDKLYEQEYARAKEYMESGNYNMAHTIFTMLSFIKDNAGNTIGFEDSADLAALCYSRIAF